MSSKHNDDKQLMQTKNDNIETISATKQMKLLISCLNHFLLNIN